MSSPFSMRGSLKGRNRRQVQQQQPQSSSSSGGFSSSLQKQLPVVEQQGATASSHSPQVSPPSSLALPTFHHEAVPPASPPRSPPRRGHPQSPRQHRSPPPSSPLYSSTTTTRPLVSPHLPQPWDEEEDNHSRPLLNPRPVRFQSSSSSETSSTGYQSFSADRSVMSDEAGMDPEPAPAAGLDVLGSSSTEVRGSGIPYCTSPRQQQLLVGATSSRWTNQRPPVDQIGLLEPVASTSTASGSSNTSQNRRLLPSSGALPYGPPPPVMADDDLSSLGGIEDQPKSLQRMTAAIKSQLQQRPKGLSIEEKTLWDAVQVALKQARNNHNVERKKEASSLSSHNSNSLSGGRSAETWESMYLDLQSQHKIQQKEQLRSFRAIQRVLADMTLERDEALEKLAAVTASSAAKKTAEKGTGVGGDDEDMLIVSAESFKALKSELDEKKAALENAKAIITSLENASGSLAADMRSKLKAKDNELASLRSSRVATDAKKDRQSSQRDSSQTTKELRRKLDERSAALKRLKDEAVKLQVENDSLQKEKGAETKQLQMEIQRLRDQSTANMEALMRKERELSALRDSLNVEEEDVGYISDDVSETDNDGVVEQPAQFNSSTYGPSQAEALATLLAQGSVGGSFDLANTKVSISPEELEETRLNLQQARSDNERISNELKSEKESLANAKMIISALEMSNKSMMEDLRSRLQDSNTAITSLLAKSMDSEKMNANLKSELKALKKQSLEEKAELRREIDQLRQRATITSVDEKKEELH